MNSNCDNCGIESNILTYHDGKFICWDCESKSEKKPSTIGDAIKFVMEMRKNERKH